MKHVTMNLLNYFWKKGIKPIIANVEKKIDSTGDASNATVSFEQAQNRTAISSGDSLKTLFGKVMKTFADLKSVAFSGSYIDLSNKPTIPTVPTSLKNPQALTFTGGVTGSYDGSAAKSVKIPSGTNNLLATVAGTWLDAVQGKLLNDKITQINSDLSKKQAAIKSRVITPTYDTSNVVNVGTDTKITVKQWGALVEVNFKLKMQAKCNGTYAGYVVAHGLPPAYDVATSCVVSVPAGASDCVVQVDEGGYLAVDPMDVSVAGKIIFGSITYVSKVSTW